MNCPKVISLLVVIVLPLFRWDSSSYSLFQIIVKWSLWRYKLSCFNNSRVVEKISQPLFMCIVYLCQTSEENNAQVFYCVCHEIKLKLKHGLNNKTLFAQCRIGESNSHHLPFPSNNLAGLAWRKWAPQSHRLTYERHVAEAPLRTSDGGNRRYPPRQHMAVFPHHNNIIILYRLLILLLP